MLILVDFRKNNNNNNTHDPCSVKHVKTSLGLVLYEEQCYVKSEQNLE